MMKALLLLASPLSALAFSNTVPFVAWSSHSSNLINRLPSAVDTFNNLFEAILLNDDVCEHEAVVLVHQPGLHASDLRHLSKSSHIARSLSSAYSSRQYAYLHAPSESASEFAQSVSEKCQSRLVNVMPGQGGIGGEKSVVMVSMPSLVGSERKNNMAESDALLSATLGSLPFSNPIVIYTGSASMHSKRQQPVFDFAPSSKSGILHRYQLLTPGLIMVLLIVLFIFLPVLYFGISAMASIQSPLRLDAAPKGYNANERKNQ